MHLALKSLMKVKLYSTICYNYIKQTSETQYVKMSEAFRKIYSHHQALYKINNVTEFTNVTKLRIKN